jgi:hypothetical protein
MAGVTKAARNPMMATTTINSTNVNPQQKARCSNPRLGRRRDMA